MKILFEISDTVYSNSYTKAYTREYKVLKHHSYLACVLLMATPVRHASALVLIDDWLIAPFIALVQVQVALVQVPNRDEIA